MNRFISYAVTVVLVAMLSGCSAATKTIMSKSQSQRTDIFKEVPASDPAPSGYADVVIKANIKTHLEGYYIGESKETPHGKQTYAFLINIDGQAVLWNVPGVRDSKPAYDEDGKTSCDPEAREGIKYVLEKKVRLSAGPYKVFFVLPGENYFVETDLTVKDGETAILEYKPVYKYKTAPTRVSTFLKDISHYEVYLNGAKMK